MTAEVIEPGSELHYTHVSKLNLSLISNCESSDRFDVINDQGLKVWKLRLAYLGHS